MVLFFPQPKISGKEPTEKKEPVRPTRVVHKPKLVVHESKVVVHKVVHSKHGEYADLEKRKLYRRDWMRRKRAGV